MSFSTRRFLARCGSALALTLAASGALADGAILYKSGPIAITPDGAFVWAVNPDHDSVSRLTTGGNAVAQFALPDIGEPQNPTGLAVTPGGEVWVACRASDRVYVLDSGGQLLADIHLAHGSGPVSVALSPDGQTALVALHGSGAVAVFDAPSRTLLKAIDHMHRRPLGITFTTNTGEAWVSHTIADGEDSFISRLDVNQGVVSALVVLKSINPKSPGDIPGDPVKVPEGGYLLLRGHIAQPPGQNFLWLPVQYHNFHNTAFTPDSTVQSAIHKIDLASGRPAEIDNRVVLTAVYAHKNDRTLLGPGWDAGISGPTDLAFSKNGQTAYLVNAQSNDVIVLPTSIGLARGNNAKLPEVPVGDNPIGAVASPVADRLYILNYLSRDISVIDTVALAEIARVPSTPGSPEPLAADVLQGAKLFNSSADPRLSINQKISCASCHPGGDSDGHTWSFAQLGSGQRKTLSLLTTSLSSGPPNNGKGQLHRGGDRDEVQDFEFTARGPLMGGTGFIGSPNAELGAPNAGLDADLDAMSAYLLSLRPQRKSPHRDPGGAIPESALRGAAIFRNTEPGSPFAVSCIQCHTPPTFTDRLFWDVKGFAPPPELQGPKFNTATLAGAWTTAPFLQGVGSYGDSWTLGGVVRNAGNGYHGNTSGLSRTQRQDLASFLNVIDDQMTQTPIDSLADTEAPRVLAVRPVSLDAVEVIFSETVDLATAGDPANFVFSDGVKLFAAVQTIPDAASGNRVRVSVPLAYHGCPVTYTLQPGPIEDVAGAIAGGPNNALDPADPRHRLTFDIDGAITITYGNTGDETFPAVSRDGSFNAGFGDVSMNHLRLYPNTSPETRGFLAFDFVQHLTADCGLTDPADILSAGFTSRPLIGHANTIEFRRCLMPWGESAGDWCFGCTGAVTTNSAKHPTIPWHQKGAAARGGSGTSPVEYYPSGAYDIAQSVDATFTVPAVNERATFASDLMTDAFRFWFTNPTLNFGWAVEVVGNNNTGLEFENAQAEDGEDGMVLSLTIAVHPQGGPCGCYADCAADGTLDLFDFLCFVNLFNAGDPYSDCTADGTNDLFDFLCFVNAFNTGC